MLVETVTVIAIMEETDQEILLIDQEIHMTDQGIHMTEIDQEIHLTDQGILTIETIPGIDQALTVQENQTDQGNQTEIDQEN